MIFRGWGRSLFPFICITFSANLLAAQATPAPTSVPSDLTQTGQSPATLQTFSSPKMKIKFGTDEEVAALAESSRDSDNGALNADFASRLTASSSAALFKAVEELFTDEKYSAFSDKALSLLTEITTSKTPSLAKVQPLIFYLQNQKEMRALPILVKLVGSKNQRLSLTALQGIQFYGKKTPIEIAQSLMASYQSADIASSTYSSLIRTLGAVNYNLAGDVFLTAAKKAFGSQETDHALAYITALAELSTQPVGAQEFYLTVYKKEDSALILRLAALKAYGQHYSPGATLDPVLREVLLGNNEQLRAAGASVLGERKDTSGADILRYKSLNDPSQKVKDASFTALASLQSADDAVKAFLTQYINDAKRPSSEKLVIFRQLLKENYGSALGEVSRYYKKIGSDQSLITFKETVSSLVLYFYKKDRGATQPSAAFFTALLKEKDPALRFTGLKGLAATGLSEDQRSAVSAMIKGLAPSSPLAKQAKAILKESAAKTTPPALGQEQKS